MAAYGMGTLPAGIRSRFVANNNGLTMHVLEAGFEVKDRPSVLLLHGFPELAYSWRKVMLPLAAAGFHVIAPDHSPVTGAPPAGTAATTATWAPSACSTWCGTRWV